MLIGRTDGDIANLGWRTVVMLGILIVCNLCRPHLDTVVVVILPDEVLLPDEMVLPDDVLLPDVV